MISFTKEMHLVQKLYLLNRMMSQIWENYVEGEEVVNGSSKVETRQKETLKVNLAV